jgi:hypothetical protein
VEQTVGSQETSFRRVSKIASVNVGVRSISLHVSSLNDVKEVGLYSLTGRLVGLFVRKNWGFEFDRSYQNISHCIYFVMIVPKNGAVCTMG